MAHLTDNSNREGLEHASVPDVMQRHYTVAEVAKLWGRPEMAVQNLFRNEPGVLKAGRHRDVLRIPESIVERAQERR